MNGFRYIRVRDDGLQASPDGVSWSPIPDVEVAPEPPVPASSPVTRIRERLEEVGREITELGRSKGAEWEAHAEGECRGLEYALRELGVSE